MIEANLGLTSGVAEMLMQSHPEGGAIGAPPVIRILPALPKQWPEGKVTGLLSRGGFEVDIEWKDGELVEATIRSLHGEPCKVRYGSQTKELKIKAGESCTVSVADFEFKKETRNSLLQRGGLCEKRNGSFSDAFSRGES